MHNFDAERNTAWDTRIEVSKDRPVAWRPRQLIALTREAEEAAGEALRRLDLGPEPQRVFDEIEGAEGSEAVLFTTERDFDVDRLSTQLLLEGHAVQPNFVYFAHCATGCGCDLGIGANPFTGNPFTGNPFTGNPFTGNPFTGNPFTGNPMVPNPFTGNAAPTRSTAKPAGRLEPFPKAVGGAHARAVIIDTGLADAKWVSNAFAGATNISASGHTTRDTPDASTPQDKLLDPIAGHGTFIAGVINHRAPDHEIHVTRALSSFGDGDAATIARRIAETISDGWIDRNTVVNLSFGAYGDPRMALVAAAVAQLQREGAVVVASAGNDGTCLPSYPAALPGVVSVGSIEPNGPAPYTNYGNWVVACAPGSDVVSDFFVFDGAEQPSTSSGADPDQFDGFAQWSGTSFAAPMVVAAIMRRMATENLDAQSAASDLLADQVSLRYPGLGLVVDLEPKIAT